MVNVMKIASLLLALWMFTNNAQKICKRNGQLECCDGYHGYVFDTQNNNCTKCITGFYGKECSIRCSYPRYGENCEKDCSSCLPDMCDFATGCITLSTQSSSTESFNSKSNSEEIFRKSIYHSPLLIITSLCSCCTLVIMAAFILYFCNKKHNIPTDQTRIPEVLIDSRNSGNVIATNVCSNPYDSLHNRNVFGGIADVSINYSEEQKSYSIIMKTKSFEMISGNTDGEQASNTAVFNSEVDNSYVLPESTQQQKHSKPFVVDNKSQRNPGSTMTSNYLTVLPDN